MILTEFFNKIFQSRFARPFLKLSGGTAFSQIITLAAYPIITRIFTPEEFGIRALFVSIAGIAVLFSSLSYEVAVPLPKKDLDAVSLILGGIFLCLFAAFLCTLFIFLPNDFFKQIGLDSILPFLWLLSIAVFFAGARNFFFHWSIRKNQHKTVASARIFRAIAKTMIELIGGFLKGGVIFLIWSWVVSSIVAAFIYFNSFWKDVGKSFKRKDVISGIRPNFYNYRRFPKFTAAAGFLNSLNLQIPIFFLTYFYSTEMVGQYSIAFVPVGLLSAVLVDSFSQLYQAELANQLNQGKFDFGGFYKSWFVKSLIFGFGGCFVLILASPTIVWLFGSRWERAAQILPAISLFLPIFFLFSLTFHTFNSIKKQAFLLSFNFLKLFLSVGLLYIAFLLNFSILNILLIYSFGLLFFMLFQSYIAKRILQKHFNE